MTKPTPAQIEAAADAIKKCRLPFSPDQLAAAALKAAAEVARQGRIANWGHPAAAEVGDPRDYVELKNIQVTAAEVGEESTMEHIARDIKAGIFPRKSEPPLDAATIERCAWTVEIAWPEAAAAIRALKDK